MRITTNQRILLDIFPEQNNKTADEVNQVLTTNLWLEMQWIDYKLNWDPDKFNNIKKLHIPSDQIWIPDIILYNNADGEPHISIMSDAIVYHTGLVVWKPPSIYKSFCTVSISEVYGRKSGTAFKRSQATP
ncbi:neurotransmitter-gated ion-channel ligand binding domain-containing protein [Ditylenchus destructor]|uniref:Neurotransmitter-gated ion-channel ligand binding domain-containing protein n=1 Tax=Ditylenchus destructor TaxID=166010 RepID=A0AAD4N2F9_9BILA|nr:neurotransmitter-gated ion-channel ligand binding domain-containing protein [Ditylenchus destructor]